MKIVLVRHGRPDEDHPLRPHDPPLRCDGWQQARAAARLLASQGITRIISSPLLRAQQTAQPLAAALGLPIHTIDGWAEADRHSARYRSTETLRALGDDAWARFLADPVRFVGGDPVQFQADVLSAWQATLAIAAADEHVAVFAHGLSINLVLAQVLGLNGIVNFRLGYANASRLIVNEARQVGVVSVNEAGHHDWPAGSAT